MGRKTFHWSIVNFESGLYAPIQRYGQQTNEADNQLQMDPVLHKISQQCQKTRSHWPEDFNHYASKRSIFGGKQFASHYKTWQKYPLTKTQNQNCWQTFWQRHFNTTNIILAWLWLPCYRPKLPFCMLFSFLSFLAVFELLLVAYDICNRYNAYSTSPFIVSNVSQSESQSE